MEAPNINRRRIHWTAPDGTKWRAAIVGTQRVSDEVDDEWSLPDEDFYLGGGGGVFQCQITQLYNADYFWCRKYDGSEQSGDHFYVAKPFLARKQGPPSGFTYTSATENARTSTDGASNTEAQVMNEPYAVGNVILVKAADHTGITVDSEELKFIEDNPERFWVHPVGTAVISGTTVLTP